MSSISVPNDQIPRIVEESLCPVCGEPLGRHEHVSSATSFESVHEGIIRTPADREKIEKKCFQVERYKCPESEKLIVVKYEPIIISIKERPF